VKDREAIIKHLSYVTKSVPSEAGLRSAELLDHWLGLHHIPEGNLAGVDWSHMRFQQLLISTIGGWASLSSFDGSGLTRLVFLAHDLAVRIELDPHHFRFLKLTMHPRPRDGGNFSARHPTLEAAVTDWRSNHPSSEAFQ
jgi:hypothetical protein